MWAGHLARNHPGIETHRRPGTPEHITTKDGIPVTTPALTLVDLATHLPAPAVEAAISGADTLNRIDPEALRAALPSLPRVPGIAATRRILDRRTFVLTDSEQRIAFGTKRTPPPASRRCDSRMHRSRSSQRGWLRR